MRTLSPSLNFILNLAKIQSLLGRRFDGGLGGLGFHEFIILYHLSCAPDKKLRRIDLAGKVGLTASGITRLLLPMEKTGLVSKEANPNDARVSYVILTAAGKRRLHNALERAELLAQEIISKQKSSQISDLTNILTGISGTI